MKATNQGGQAQHHSAGGGGGAKNFGIYIGKVKDASDKEGLGRLRVWISQLSSTAESNEKGWFTVRYCPPFAGGSNTPTESKSTSATEFAQTSQSYGMWMVPPHPDVQVICGFINGELHQGIWWACLPFDSHTHALPGIASGLTHKNEIKPLAERNRYNKADPNEERRPKHPKSAQINVQGLGNDLRRGHNNASPFRAKGKHPGYAYGFLTPGQNNLLLDDGADGNGGKIQFRTRKGNQILLDAEEGFIYFSNASGTAWVEIENTGNIDMYCSKNFSVHAGENINFHANQDININAGGGLNLSATKNAVVEACEEFNITGTANVKITSAANVHILADSQMRLSANRIDLNGPVADRATLPSQNSLITNSEVGKSISVRVPEAEPYGGHSHKGGEQPTAGDVPSPAIVPAPESYKDIPPATKSNAIDCVPDITEYRISEEAFNANLSREAYRGMQYSDYLGYSVGYGTRVDIWGPGNPASKLDPNIKQALKDGPSEAEARTAARQIMDRHISPPLGARLKKAIAGAGKPVCVTQSQVDALHMAAFGNPSAAYEMADQLVASGVAASDGKPTREDIAKIWANGKFSNSAEVKSKEAQFAMTGEIEVKKTQQDLLSEGVKSDEAAVRNNKARNPDGKWDSEDGGGPAGGKRLQPDLTKPTAQQQAQYERSNYLNTGNVPPGSRLTKEQLQDKYGSPHTGGNAVAGTPTQPDAKKTAAS
jgi:hypothetical protein